MPRTTKEAYKNIVNRLSRCELRDSLEVIWAYSNLAAFKKPLSKDIKIDRNYMYELLNDKVGLGINLLVNLPLVLRDVLNFSTIYSKNTLKNWSFFANTINKYQNDLKNAVTDEFDIINPINIGKFMFNISHEQFKHQVIPAEYELQLMYFIYNHHVIRNFIEKKTKLNLEELFLQASISIEQFMKYPLLNFERSEEKYQHKSLLKFYEYFYKPIEYYRMEYSDIPINAGLVYPFIKYNLHPIIRVNFDSQEYLYCMDSRYILWKLTRELYKEINTGVAPSELIGDQFEKYFKNVITNNKLDWLPGHSTDRRKSVDFVANVDDSVLFIECKCRPAQNYAANEAHIGEHTLKDIEKISDGLVQIYSSIKSYLEGNYREIAKFYEKEKIVPIMLTLFETGYNSLYYDIQTILFKKLEDRNIDINLVEKYPFIICSIYDFEIYLGTREISNLESFWQECQQTPNWYVYSVLSKYDKKNIIEILYSKSKERLLNSLKQVEIR